ncbi:hypothetical protein Pla163_32110 [Planctomycetes bacterium Pla163]|jgi:hypothetical protein|uniref:Penicillin-binding protein activator LpoB n=1 Tax=Rohdeia mirabilis TaxID=2528008 RepID=A0A518D3K4_9BACT|nr:hypothetical protein Pla163_32110 [Planctomycetes bacterium Pla163]
MHFTKVLTIALCALSLAACKSGPTGRIKDAGEAIGVDRSRGGTAVYDEITADTMEKLLDRHRRQVNVQNPGGYLVAFVGLDTLGAEELRDQKPAIYDRIEESIVNSGVYRMISMRFVDRARQEAGLTQTEDLFIAKYRTAFLANLAEEGLSPDYLIWGKMTTQTSQIASGLRERRYRLSLEMIDSRSGLTVAKESGERMKEYED